MINIESLEPKGFKRTRKVNGERTIELDILPTENNKNYFDLVVEEASVNALDDRYIIKKLSESSIGKTYWKQATAIHEFFVTLINKQQPQIHNGSITFNNYMNMVFEDTGYSFAVVDQFLARSFENLGNDNRLALLQKGLERFGAEFELVGSQVRFKKQIGNDTDFQFRFGHNIKAISKEVDTTNLATVIRGTGDPELGITAYYRSPNADIFGEIDAPPVNDERFKSEESLLEEMKARLQDTPEVSITIDFVDLRAAGYPYTVPNEGDRVYLIYEPMDDLLIETRIMEIEEIFDVNMNPIRTEVTLANYKKSFAGTMFENVKKQLSDIVNDDGVIKYSALDEAVKIATEALQSAQTELEFNNGIIAREKNDPNRLVLLNSGGIGISKDGGNTFTEAITADGFVLTAGAIGRLDANNIRVGPESSFDDGYDPKKNLDYLDNYINNEFKVGIMDESEAQAMETYLNTLKYEKESIENRINRLIDSKYVDEILISTLIFGYFSFESAYFDLVDAINDAIADGKVTEPEKQEVDSRFEEYLHKLTRLIEIMEEAESQIPERMGTYIGPDGIYTGTLTADQIQTSFNDIGNQVKISAAGLSTYVDGLRSSLLRGSGHTFYRDGNEVGEVGTAAWVNDPNYHGLLFRLNNPGDYMTWAFEQEVGDNPTTMLSWHKTSAKTNKGFTFGDDVRISNYNTLRNTYFRSDNNTNRIVSLKNWTFAGLNGVVLRRDSNRDGDGAGIFMTSARVILVAPSSAGSSEHNTLEVTRNYIRAIQVWGQTTSSAANVRVGRTNASLMRSTSASKYKLLIENEEEKGYNYKKILDLNISSWFDKFAVESYANYLDGKLTKNDIESLPITRHFGLIAEDLIKVGLPEFVSFANGKPEGIEYDRLWVTLVPIVREHEYNFGLYDIRIKSLENRFDEYDKRFGTMESRIDRMEVEIEKLKGAS